MLDGIKKWYTERKERKLGEKIVKWARKCYLSSTEEGKSEFRNTYYNIFGEEYNPFE